MSIRLELGRNPMDTHLYVDGVDILPRLHARRVRFSGEAGVGDLTRLSIECVAMKGFSGDLSPGAVVKALRDEADRIEALYADDEAAS